jgi:hypothetical protein
VVELQEQVMDAAALVVFVGLRGEILENLVCLRYLGDGVVLGRDSGRRRLWQSKDTLTMLP